MTTFLVILASCLATYGTTVVIQNLFSSERKVEYQVAPEYSVADPTFERVLGHLLGPPIVGGNRITSLLNGDQIFPAMLSAIRAAQKTITFETYIYWSGDIGGEFSDALSKRAKAGVRVHVLLDWIGSGKLDPKMLEEMK